MGVGACLHTANYIGNDITHSPSLDRAQCRSYKALPKYSFDSASKTAREMTGNQQ